MISKFIIDDLHENPAINMAFDELLFEEITEPAIYLRFYKWSRPFCSFGYSQRVKNKPDLQKQYELVRRPTGGGFVFHGTDICLSISASIQIHPKFATLNESYNFLHSIILKGLNQSDLMLFSENKKVSGNYSCFEKPVPADIMLGAEKIVGSAQKRTQTSFLQQGSIFLPEINAQEIIKSFEEELNLKFEKYEYSPEDLNRAKELLKIKYENDEWNLRI